MDLKDQERAIERLKSVLGQIGARNIKDVTEDEASYCMNRGWAINVAINGKLQLELTPTGKDRLKTLCE